MKLNDIFKEFENQTLPALSEPYVIAEAGVNHGGDLDMAKHQIDLAADGGFQAIKFQTYKAEKIAAQESPYYWDLNEEPTESQFQLFKKYDKFWKKEYEALKKHCDTRNIEFLSTPFDTESADFLAPLMPAMKISSSDLNNLPFIAYLCKKDLPILLSTGASYLWEIQRTLELIQSYGNPVSLMHCVLNYPTPNDQANLGMLLDLKKHFPNTLMGYSDHTLPKEMDMLLNAYLLGAKIIEKHFTHDKTLQGNDHYHAMDKDDMKVFKGKLAGITQSIGATRKTVLESEKKSRANARRSLIADQSIEKGTIITSEHITWKRPASGISPENFDDLLGLKATGDIDEDTILQWHMFN